LAIASEEEIAVIPEVSHFPASLLMVPISYPRF
jgi:hypothetical protein